MDRFEDLVGAIASKAKALGFKKNRLAWYKVNTRLTVVLSIQKSQYDSNIWYYNYGICLHDIATGNMYTINACQIKYRLDNVVDGVFMSPDNIINLLMKWESMYGSIESLKVKAIQGNLPIQSTRDAIRYLTTVNIVEP